MQLGFPFQIRADAITAVGAPSSIGFLVRALYWLYLVARSFYRSKLPGAITELASEEEDGRSHTETEKSQPSNQDDGLEELFQDILDVVEHS